MIVPMNWAEVLSLFGVLGGLIAFLFWERRRKTLEIEKLQLEIDKLKEGASIVHRPTPEEIREILRQTERWEAEHRHLGEEDRVDAYGKTLRAFLTEALACRSEARMPAALHEAWARLQLDWRTVRLDAYLRWPTPLWSAINDLLTTDAPL